MLSEQGRQRGKSFYPSSTRRRPLAVSSEGQDHVLRIRLTHNMILSRSKLRAFNYRPFPWHEGVDRKKGKNGGRRSRMHYGLRPFLICVRSVSQLLGKEHSAEIASETRPLELPKSAEMLSPFTRVKRRPSSYRESDLISLYERELLPEKNEL